MKKNFLVLGLLISVWSVAQSKNEWPFLVGTYTDSGSEGIYWYKTDSQLSEFEKITSVFVKNPSYLAISPDEKFLFSVSENDMTDSEFFSFALDKKAGTIIPINQQNTLGGAPCYIIYDADNELVMTANYTGGNISVFPVEKNGTLKEASQIIPFSKNSHLHSVRKTPNEKRFLAADLGADKLYSFELKNKTLQRVESEDVTFSKGTGPRHFTFSSDGKYLYVLGELSRKITAFKSKENRFKQIQTIETDTFIDGKGAADIHISPNGKFLYASNRLVNDGIAIFSIRKSGKLKKIGYQPTKAHPRNFTFSPDGKYILVASRDENSIQVFEIQENGLLYLKKEFSVPKPVCVLFFK